MNRCTVSKHLRLCNELEDEKRKSQKIMSRENKLNSAFYLVNKSQRDVISQIKDELGVAKQYDSYMFEYKLDQRRGSEHMISDTMNIISLVPGDCSSISSKKEPLLPNVLAQSHSDNRMQKYHKATSLSYDIHRIDRPVHIPHLPLHKVMEKSDLNIDREHHLQANHDRSESFHTMFGINFFEKYKHTLDKCIGDHVFQTFNTRSVLEIVHPVSKRNCVVIFYTAEYIFSFYCIRQKRLVIQLTVLNSPSLLRTYLSKT